MLRNVHSRASTTKEIFQSCKCYPGTKQNKVYDFLNLSLHLHFVIYINYLFGMKPVKPCCITSASDTLLRHFPLEGFACFRTLCEDLWAQSVFFWKPGEIKHIYTVEMWTTYTQTLFILFFKSFKLSLLSDFRLVPCYLNFFILCEPSLLFLAVFTHLKIILYLFLKWIWFD